MKKIYILIIAVLLGGIAKGQWQNQATKPNAQEIINKTLSGKIPKENFPKQVKNQKASNTISWDYDSIITYDTSNVQIQRITQTFDNSGNKLTQILEDQNNAAANNYKFTYTYDTNGNMITYLDELWDFFAWENFKKYTYTYDTNGNMLTEFEEYWEFIQNGSGSYHAWVNDEKHTYTYNANGNKLTEFIIRWQNNTWVNYEKHTYTYNTNGNKLTDLWEYWYNNAWVNKIKYTYTYDASGNMLTDLTEGWNNNAWVNNTRYTYTYDANGNMLTNLYQKSQNNAWKNFSKYTYTYDTNGNKLTDLLESWENNAWVNYYKHTYTYNANGDILTDLWEIWNSYSNTWNNKEKHYYTYNANGNMLTDLKETWYNYAWGLGIRKTYTYDSYGNSITGKYEVWSNNNWVLASTSSLDVFSSQQKLISVSGRRYQAHFISSNNPMPLAAGTISGASAVCQGQTNVTYNVPAITNATSYIWTFPSGSSGTSSTNAITVNYSTSAVSGNITVKGSNVFGTGDSSTLAITVNPLPGIVGNISGLATVCLGQASVNYSVPTITNATSYLWTLPNGASGTSTTNSIIVNYDSSAVSGNITVKGENICGNGLSSSLPINVNNLPFQAGAISGQNSVCINQSLVSYSISTINNATSYNWTLPPGATGNSTTNSINVDYGNNATSGNISVYGINSCGNGIQSSLPINVDSISNAADTISGNTAVLAGQQNVFYSIPSIPNATNYMWNVPAGVSLNTYSGNTISVNFSQAAVSGNISVYGSNYCGDGVASSLYVTVNPFNPNCSAQFDLVADTTTPHRYFAVNNASGIPPLQYNWSWGDGTFSTTAYPTHTYSASGNYKICLTIIDSVGCTTTYCDSSYLQKDPNAIISVQVIPQGSLGISSLLTDKIKIYPNPAKENLIIELIESNISQNTTISIYNIQGQLCRQIISNQSKTEIDIKDLSKGLYFVKLNNEKESFVSKFVKE